MKDPHTALKPIGEQVRSAAAALTTSTTDLTPTLVLLGRLGSRALPNEHGEQALLYPAVARVLGGEDPSGVLSRGHAEIEHQISRRRRLLDELNGASAEPEDVVELRRLLYGLCVVPRLHNAGEEEAAFSLIPDRVVAARLRLS